MQNVTQHVLEVPILIALAVFISVNLVQLVVQFAVWSVDQFNAQFARRYQRLNIICQELVVQVIVSVEIMVVLMALEILLAIHVLLLVSIAYLPPHALLA